MPVACPQPLENSQLANPAHRHYASITKQCQCPLCSALTINPARPQTCNFGSAVLLAPCSWLQTRLFASTVPVDHPQGLPYHSLPHAAEAKADPALKRFTHDLCAGIISQIELADMTAGTRVSQNTAKAVVGTEPDYPASLVLLPTHSGIQLCVPGWAC